MALKEKEKQAWIDKNMKLMGWTQEEAESVWNKCIASGSKSKKDTQNITPAAKAKEERRRELLSLRIKIKKLPSKVERPARVEIIKARTV